MKRFVTIVIALSVVSLACSVLIPDVVAPQPTIDIKVAARQTIEANAAARIAQTLAPVSTEVSLQEPTFTTVPTYTPQPTSTPTDEATATLALANHSSCVPTSTQVDVGTVVNVVDGDTISAFLNGEVWTIRYIGIDSPETRHPTRSIEYFGQEAADANRQLVEGKLIFLVKDVSETDQYGRLLRYVFVESLDGLFVNYELVKLGFAKAVTYPPDIACAETFLAAEQAARAAEVGLWRAPAIPSLTPALTKPASAPCNCTGPDLDCKDFSSQAAAQRCYNHCKSLGYGDIFRLDGDGDGKVCESLP